MDLWEEDNGELYKNDKREGYKCYLNLPNYVTVPLELAILFGPGDEQDEQLLLTNGWRLCSSHAVAGSPSEYQQYIQNSRGEFSCVKPSCVRLQNAWVSDRSLCYLASGKPVIVQHTGKSRILPDDAGVLRFQNITEAIRCLHEAANNYEIHCRLARGLAEEYFDARKITAQLLERVL
jgi:hypothetical protein